MKHKFQYLTIREFQDLYKDYITEGGYLNTIIMPKMQEDRDFDWQVIDAIAGNTRQQDVEDCIRLLLHQNNDLLEHIFYDLMYDLKTGEENDFIPINCTYEQLLEILLKLSGKEETCGEKMQRKAKRVICGYNEEMKKLKKELDSLEEQYEEKINKLEEKYQEKLNQLTDNYFNTLKGQLEWQQQNIKILTGVIKYKSSEEKTSLLEIISKKKVLLENIKSELKSNNPISI